MCGVLGLVSFRSEPSSRQIAALNPLLSHRGPDASGVANLGPACFGHTRLSILGVHTDEARQPVCQRDCLLSFNGEIYNFKELSAELRNDGIKCSGNSDTETLFLCLVNWGVDRTLAKLDGMYAFGFFDGRNQNLHLARDPIGEKSLYWNVSGERLWFASEIKVLLATGEVSHAPNLSRIDDYLYTTKVNGADTMFRDVTELEPGTVLTFSKQGGPQIRSFWRLEDCFENTGSVRADETAEAFSDYLTQAVESRRVSDVPVGVLASGGIDSNALIELLLSARPNDTLDLFFADNFNPEMSERPDVEIFLSHAQQRHPEAALRFHPNFQPIDEYLDWLERLTWHYDEPVQYQNSPLLGGLCERARQEGIKVLFSGEGMDEILHGYVRFERTMRLLEGVDDRNTILSHFYFGGGLHSVELVKQLTRGVSEGAEASASWRWLETHLDQPLELLQLVHSQKFRMQTLLQRQDRIGMAESIEIRVPFVAPRFLNWVNRLSGKAKFNSETKETKVMLRQVMSERLPQRILTKSKDGFPTDMGVWLRQDRMQQLATEFVQDSNGFCQSYLDGNLANEIVTDHFSGGERHDMMVWQLFSLEMWHRTFGNGVSTALTAS